MQAYKKLAEKAYDISTENSDNLRFCVDFDGVERQLSLTRWIDGWQVRAQLKIDGLTYHETTHNKEELMQLHSELHHKQRAIVSKARDAHFDDIERSIANL